IAASHSGQWLGGKTIDSSRGYRWMTTLRKEPTIAPKTVAKKASSGVTGVIVKENEEFRIANEEFRRGALLRSQCAIRHSSFSVLRAHRRCPIRGRMGSGGSRGLENRCFGAEASKGWFDADAPPPLDRDGMTE